MPNYNPETGIRYGVIACNSLDDNLVQELFYGSGAKNISEEEAQAEVKADAERRADAIEEDAYEAARDRFGRHPFTTQDFQAIAELHEAEIDASYERQGYSGRDDFIEQHSSTEWLEIDEPTIEGEYEGVKFRISWLGGAPLLWVLEGPLGCAERLCSPCVPNAGDLDSGFILEEEFNDPQHGEDNPCYCVPRGWLRKEHE